MIIVVSKDGETYDISDLRSVNLIGPLAYTCLCNLYRKFEFADCEVAITANSKETRTSIVVNNAEDAILWCLDKIFPLNDIIVVEDYKFIHRDDFNINAELVFDYLKELLRLDKHTDYYTEVQVFDLDKNKYGFHPDSPLVDLIEEHGSSDHYDSKLVIKIIDDIRQLLKEDIDYAKASNTEES